MKSFLLSDNRDTYLGMKLAGIDGIYVQEKSRDAILKAYTKALSGGYGIVFITEKIYAEIKEEVLKTKRVQKTPLITIIPDRHGFQSSKEQITSYIKESIGL